MNDRTLDVNQVFDTSEPARIPWYVGIEKYLKPNDTMKDIETIYPCNVDVFGKNSFHYYKKHTGKFFKDHPCAMLEAYIYDVDQETALKMARDAFAKRFEQTMGVA